MFDFVGRVCAIAAGVLLFPLFSFIIKGETTKAVLVFMAVVILVLLALVVFLLQDE